MNGLMICLEQRNQLQTMSVETKDKFLQYLIENVYHPNSNSNTSISINDTNYAKQTALQLAMSSHQASAVKILLNNYAEHFTSGKTIRENQKKVANRKRLARSWEHLGAIERSIRYFVEFSNWDYLSWMLDNPKLQAIMMKEEILFVDLTEDKDYVFDLCVENEDISIFASLLFKLIELYEINSFGRLKSVLQPIINEERFEKWFSICTSGKTTKPIFLSFLTTLYEVAWKNENFEILMTFLKRNCVDSEQFKVNEEVLSLSDQYCKDFQNAQYLMNHCKQSTLNDLSNVVNNGLLNHECGFNDSLLFLSKMVNNEQFISNLESTTKECLTQERKNIKKYTFFKNNLLHSNIWAMSQQDKLDHDEIKTDVNAYELKELNVKIEQSLTLFDKIKRDVVDGELKAQQMYIQNNILSEVKNNNDLWKRLISNEIEEFKSISSYGQKPKYEFKSLPFDNVNGFDGRKEYDYNQLTNELISSHYIDPIFQFDLKNVFSLENFGIKCLYTGAPVKTKSRCITKAELDYKEKAC